MKLEFETNMLVTNKGFNIRCINKVEKTSFTLDTEIKRRLAGNLIFLGSEKLDKAYPNHYSLLKKLFGSEFKLSPNISLFGDGSIEEQLKYSKKYRITIEEI